MTEHYRAGVVSGQSSSSSMYARREPANLGDILERVLDRGVVIAGDIRVNLLDIELLTIKLRLIIASVDTAREMGIDWWEHDPWLTGRDLDLVEENRRLRRRVSALEGGHSRHRSIEPIEAEVEEVEERRVRRTEPGGDGHGGS
ncbi:gas vesicle protein [Nonomuraea sp. NPDC004297]